ncbi:MAG: hypothetical protein KGM16_16960 [Bacteroidota bacterium]|nr:hypothetical protein [Bacteroidota bacterium]
MKDKISDAKIRERILSSGYGKFDLIDAVYSKEEILSAKPRILLKNIIDRFSIPDAAINRKTFWSWLQRYKKKNRSFISARTSLLQVEKSRPEKVAEQSEEWETFKPSDAESLKQNKTLIKLIK